MNEIEMKEKGLIKRLTNKTFNFDPRLKEGFFTANYFLKTRKIVIENIPNQIVTMQFFQREDDVMVCGLDECIALIHEFAVEPETLKIEALNDGDIINYGEPALKITGKYENFGFLESMIDGILARRSSVCTNTYRVMKVLNGKGIINMADRQDEYNTQIGDGYASYVAGLKADSTDAMGAWWGGKGLGTMPHALIQICDGDICKAADFYLKTFPEEKVTALLPEIDLSLHLDGKVVVNDQDITKEIRTTEVADNVSYIASYKKIRLHLVELQRKMSKNVSVVMDGRDIGSYVLPHADVKIFQVASVETRAVRRYKENLEKGINCSIEEIEENLRKRDYIDSHREFAPLKKAEDSFVLDTSNMTIDEAVNAIIKIVKNKLGEVK